ncbi:protease modulator HflC [Spirochaetia bacterium 38H-sp]|uniref:Protein HflC n=1 Tax=Rarispira pelagica TaxID=3141764 RepID=A0ABU9UEK2_9SPIR
MSTVQRIIAVTAIIIGILVFIVLVAGPFYIVQEGEQAVILRFGQIVKTEKEAGLKFKTPFIDNVKIYSKKILSWDGEPQRIPTSEQQFIWVDTTARWKITDPAKFYSRIQTMNTAYSRLDDIIDSAVRTVISSNPLREAVRNSNIINEKQRANDKKAAIDAEYKASITNEIESVSDSVKQYTSVSSQQAEIEKGRKELSEEMLKLVKGITESFGVEVIDVVMRQIRYSEDLTQSVYQRMIKERNQIAQAYRSYGEGKKEEWLGKLQKDKQKIISEAQKTADEIKGQADAEATKIYAEAFSKDPSFFKFWRALQSYEITLPDIQKVMSTNPDYFDYLFNPNTR